MSSVGLRAPAATAGSLRRRSFHFEFQYWLMEGRLREVLKSVIQSEGLAQKTNLGATKKTPPVM